MGRTITRVVSERTGRVSYRARLTSTDAAGRRHELSKTHPTRKAAEAWLSRVEHEQRSGTYRPPSRETVGSYLDRWADTLRPRPPAGPWPVPARHTIRGTRGGHHCSRLDRDE